MTKIYYAHYDSRNFIFDAFGKTAAEAKQALLEGLKTHATQYNTDDKHWWYDDDIWVEEFVIGKCYRDYSLVQKDAS
jgi:hypothetical protein